MRPHGRADVRNTGRVRLAEGPLVFSQHNTGSNPVRVSRPSRFCDWPSSVCSSICEEHPVWVGAAGGSNPFARTNDRHAAPVPCGGRLVPVFWERRRLQPDEGEFDSHSVLHSLCALGADVLHMDEREGSISSAATTRCNRIVRGMSRLATTSFLHGDTAEFDSLIPYHRP